MKTDTIAEIFQNHPNASRDSLIPILQEVQEREGFLSKEAVLRIGEFLKLPASKIYGVATFYNQFRFQPVGKYHIQVCRGTACHVKGSAAVLSAMEQELKIKAGETSRDGLFSIEVVACIGACGLAPVISVNGEIHAGLDPMKVRSILAGYKNKEQSGEQA
ncbi:MAG: NADH dehydrogenase [Lentisphaerae bacterium GWF2_52_8]|nr:MAG: NADH dehydrogenase [Lentisphaerae bacterium GWF2_52_8]